MKKIISLLASTRIMLFLLLVFGVAIALATFIENDFGTDSARKLVYNAKWFEVVLILGCLNLLAVTYNLKLFTRKKFTLLLFHIAFVLILIGAGITRYFGNEGSMHIREGETTSTWLTTENYIEIACANQTSGQARSYPYLLAPASANRFSKTFSFEGNLVKVKLLNYLPSVSKIIVPGTTGDSYLHFVTTHSGGRQEFYLRKGEVIATTTFILEFADAFADHVEDGTVQVVQKEGVLYFRSVSEAKRMTMATQEEITLQANEVHTFLPGSLHTINGMPLVLKQFIPHGVEAAQPTAHDRQSGLYAVLFEVTVNGVKKEYTVFTQKNTSGEYTTKDINGVKITMRYGPEKRSLPFQLRLNNFILKRYPGSESPSWFESDVQLIDPEKNINRAERVFMNNILKHRGYRFYQSSYDTDEQGTILSINRDGVGTSVTYLGYLLMTIGMLLSLLNRNSRFIKLIKVKLAGSSAYAILPIAFLLITIGSKAQGDSIPYTKMPEITAIHASEFGRLKVQDNGGRIEPINTLASEVLRKVSRVEQYKNQTAEQVLLGMLAYPEAWQAEPIIRVGHDQIREILGITTKKAAFNNFFGSDIYGGYVLQPYVEEAHQKKPAYRSKFDNELIRVDERVNVSYLAYSGALLRLFPNPNDSTHTWHSPLSVAKVFTGEDSVFTKHILNYYLQEVRKSVQTGDWSLPDEMLRGLSVFQQSYGAAVMPTERKMAAEAFYNNADLFNRITRIYLLVGLLLLIVQFIGVFINRFKLSWLNHTVFGIIALTFLVHTFTLGLRWYVAGHAPWSNGYEALTFIAWATVLAGVLFYRRSAMAISATAVLAGLILQTAHLSWMDPQVTNLVPVLQSYWLIIHVAVITASYGFLGLGALLAAVNLLLYFFQGKGNYNKVDDQIKQIQRVIETTIIAGLYLLSIGTFLGGVWANESWGRYWAWDPKETWALVTIIVYAVILHLRLVPGLKGRVLFTVSSLFGFGSVIMTYFGVNYYLSGLHSYAAGDPLPVPPVVYYSLAIAIVLSVIAAINQFQLNKKA